MSVSENGLLADYRGIFCQSNRAKKRRGGGHFRETPVRAGGIAAAGRRRGEALVKSGSAAAGSGHGGRVDAAVDGAGAGRKPGGGAGASGERSPIRLTLLLSQGGQFVANAYKI